MAAPGSSSTTWSFRAEAQATGLENFVAVRSQLRETDREVNRLSASMRGMDRQSRRTSRTLLGLRSALNGIFRALDIVTKGSEDWNRAIKGLQAGIQSLLGIMQFFTFVANALKTTEWGRAAAQTAAGGIAAPAIAAGIATGVAAVAGLMTAYGGSFAKGGVAYADRPTLALYGEAGPEVATFTPVGASPLAPSLATAPLGGDVYLYIESRDPEGIGRGHQRYARLLKEAGRL